MRVQLDPSVAAGGRGGDDLDDEVGRALHTSIGDQLRSDAPDEDDVRLQVVALAEQYVEGRRERPTEAVLPRENV